MLPSGQAVDSSRFTAVLAGIKVHVPVGRPRIRSGAVAADTVYSSRTNRANRGSRGGHPVRHDAALCTERVPVKRVGGPLFFQAAGLRVSTGSVV
ncbi:hypothetical protein Pve01_57710 [Planomonospora venezuelensis]|nr:hypothetical protein Pve01_57710 [Planomonospora venezuelensis]